MQDMKSRRTWIGKGFALVVSALLLAGTSQATPGGCGEGGGRPPVVPPASLTASVVPAGH